jgi:hypothetical protein
MAHTAFPLASGKGLRLGATWIWRVDVLAADKVECRLLTAFELSKEAFMACLTYKRGNAYVVVARLEYHGNEPGLHCHASCEQLHDHAAGVVKPLGVKRLPRYGVYHRRSTYGITEVSALGTAFQFFRVSDVPEGVLL